MWEIRPRLNGKGGQEVVYRESSLLYGLGK
jgi:hypothetical protein